MHGSSWYDGRATHKRRLERKRRPSKLPAVGATLVVARFAHRGNGATTRVAPTSSLRRHEPTVIAFHDAAIPSDWLKRASSKSASSDVRSCYDSFGSSSAKIS